MNDLKEKTAKFLENRRLVTFIIAIIASAILTLTAQIPALENYTIVYCEDTASVETCELVESDIEKNLMGVTSELLGIVFNQYDGADLPNSEPVSEATELPEVTVTVTQTETVVPTQDATPTQETD